MVAVGQAVDEFVDQGSFGGEDYFLVAGVRAAVADVVEGVGGEDHRVLRDDGDAVAQVAQAQLADVLAVEADAAA